MAAKATLYTSRELGWAWSVAISVQMVFFTLLIVAGKSRASIKEKPVNQEKVIPIAVRPVVDDLPLLKLGGKRVRAKLPDMWKKNPPVQRFEASSAPSPMAEQTPEAIPSTPLTKPDAAPPPPDAEVAKEVDQVLLDAGAPPSQPNVDTEGSPDGVKGGTETDPLKARVLSQYQAKIHAWFNARFRQPTQVDCETLKTLRASVVVSIGSDRQIVSYSIVKPSGNPTFDERVRSSMDNNVGQQLPPPPPLYPDLLNTNVRPVFQGQCD
ncbi:MAG: TonB C-terminal domain-containing protein [Polyangiaceae bacterium]